MHELSLVAGLIEQLDALLDEHGAKRLSRVKLVAGPFSGICADSLRFAYQALTADNPRYAASLFEIETAPARFVCAACGHVCGGETEVLGQGDSRPERCPRCGDQALAPQTGGGNLILQQVELEEE